MQGSSFALCLPYLWGPPVSTELFSSGMEKKGDIRHLSCFPTLVEFLAKNRMCGTESRHHGTAEGVLVGSMIMTYQPSHGCFFLWACPFPGGFQGWFQGRLQKDQRSPHGKTEIDLRHVCPESQPVARHCGSLRTAQTASPANVRPAKLQPVSPSVTLAPGEKNKFARSPACGRGASGRSALLVCVVFWKSRLNCKAHACTHTHTPRDQKGKSVGAF